MRHRFFSYLVCFGLTALVCAGCKHRYSIPAARVDPLVEARDLTKAGKPQEAYERFEDILRADPNNLTAHRGLVEAAYFAGRLEQVARRYQGMAGGSSAGIGAYGLGLVEISRGPGHMQAALKQFSRAAELLPESADVPFRIGLVYLLNGEYEQAEKYLEQAIVKDPNRADIYVARGDALLGQGKRIQAVKSMAKILSLSPSASVASKACTVAAKVFDPLRGTDPDLARDLEKVVELLDHDYVQQGLSEVEKILDRQPDNPFANVLKGLAHSRLQNDGEAVVAFEHALDLRPESPLALIGLGDVYARLQKWGKARSYYEKASSMNPFDLDARKRMGILASKRRDYARAASVYASLVLLAPDDIDYRYKYALALFSEGKIREAIGVYEGILEMKPDDLESLVRLGSLYAALSKGEPERRDADRDKARAFLARAHELSPENEAIQEMLAKVED